MREKRTVQSSIFEMYPEHETGYELKGISQWLDQNRDLLELVYLDIGDPAVQQTGRKGLSVESVLRCAILKQFRQLSYDELVFCLMDSRACQAFARLDLSWPPQKSVLQKTISAISSASWEKINQRLLHSAQQDNVEKGTMFRIDSTVTETDIHAPTDSNLLWDSVRTLIRLLKQAQDFTDATLPKWRNHQRLAKKRMRAIVYTRGKDKKVQLYRDLIEATEKTLRYVEQAEQALWACNDVCNTERASWFDEVNYYKPLIQRIIDQTQRRVLKGEKVPADEKIFSLFEDHTDIVVKGNRRIQYGHKLNLSTGRSGLILDIVIESGNPADSDQFIPMLNRHIDNYGKAPRQSAADGSYASTDNLHKAKALGITDVVFHKKRGLKVEDMAKSAWVYRKLRNFRAGIEAGISCMKRVYGLTRCTWKGLTHFKAYIWSSVVVHNLVLFARLRPD